MNSPIPVRLAYEVDLSYAVQAAGADFIFNVQAARTPRQHVLGETLSLPGGAPVREDTDPETRGRFLRVRADVGPITLRYAATVEIVHHLEDPTGIQETGIPALPGSVLPFLYPSRYCPSDTLNAFAMAQFGSLWQGYGRVQAICDWVQRNVAFVPGSSCGTTTAADTLRQGQGVCRDFAHLMIALCRAINIPARFTTGLDYGADPALGPTDFHAYVEAYVGGRWRIFDPSGTAIPMGFVRLTSGRDAADSAYASIFGNVVPQARRLAIWAVPGQDGVVREPYRGWEAVSTDDGPSA
ncbi:MAG TPA: transglutaminase family protein [Ramlibacter sp.]|jgi:transglutaminase-like putative cysteine protease|uniref:transglutaminase-like domain-containing protein n=1 Tax=Ramlibacter sp. TaxID=1917967 RepID=UPI002D50F139|nr:transglutaminase family protein [Ramlibacter sp.]HZY20707.1 transglutaminase family protein [Ramlibacter sp.]